MKKSANREHEAATVPQVDKFKDLARELEADESEEHFEETVRKIAPRPEGPPQNDD
jgi:hypothetical protein